MKRLVLFVPAMAVLLSLGCSSSSTSPGTGASSSGAASDGGSNVSADASIADARPGSSGDAATEEFIAAASDFDCLKNSEWTTVGIARYKNMLGHTAEMLAVARSDQGGTLPVGTIVQLVPIEAMVKRGNGFNEESHDWEFFTLDVTASGATIKSRGGGPDVKNFLGSSCLSCHKSAAPQWDFICGDKVDGGNTHGCDPLPIAGSTLANMADPSCK
jgi:hypothetical protein